MLKERLGKEHWLGILSWSGIIWFCLLPYLGRVFMIMNRMFKKGLHYSGAKCLSTLQIIPTSLVMNWSMNLGPGIFTDIQIKLNHVGCNYVHLKLPIEVHLYIDIADKKNLQPMYSNLFEAISQYDQKHLIFFEPTVIFTSVCYTRHQNKCYSL